MLSKNDTNLKYAKLTELGPIITGAPCMINTIEDLTFK